MTIYTLTLLFTDYTITGWWPNIIFCSFLIIISWVFIFRHKSEKSWLTITMKTIVVAFSVLSIWFSAPVIFNPFAWDNFGMRSFYFQKVDGRLFNAYFTPVGAYSGGYGRFLITESPIYFPLIEQDVYYNRTVDHDFSDDMFDGQPTDNYAIVRQYIKEDVINKKP